MDKASTNSFGGILGIVLILGGAIQFFAVFSAFKFEWANWLPLLLSFIVSLIATEFGLRLFRPNETGQEKK